MQHSINIHDIRQALHTPVSQDALRQVQAKLVIKPGELISPHDDRLSLAKLWMDDDPAAQSLFTLWRQLKDMSAEALVVSLLSSLISLLGSQYMFHSYATPVIKTILSNQWLRRLNTYLGGTHKEQILATLKLFNAISAFAGGQERKLVLETFPWDNKNRWKLFSMRRKETNRNILFHPDICTSYVLLVLSMVDRNTASLVKARFIEQHRETFSSIFKGLVQDQYSLVQKVLEVCWEGLWSDPKVKRTLKVAVFNEATILHILKLYDRATAEMQEGEHTPADIAHHFLLAICTRPGHGICFRDRGWYPWKADDNKFANEEPEDHHSQRKDAHSAKLYNKILANILPKLKVNEDPRQQELTLRIVEACPELVYGYWSTAALSLEPNLSSKWIANLMFVGQVISQAVPSSTFLLPGSNETYMPTPPPLPVIMANVLPSIGIRSLFTRGLQFNSAAIIRHCTATVLAKCLRKLAEVVRTFKMIETALEEDEEGPWCRRRKEVEKEARQHVPDFQVVIAFWQQTSASPANSTTHALLSESSQRLLRLYQESLPDVVAEAKFEVGKLLNLISDPGPVNPTSEGDHGLVVPALQSVVQLHVLHILRKSDQFTCTAASSHAYLHVLLKSFCDVRASAFRDMLRALLQHVLGESVLFQEHPSDIDLWLAALPSGALFRGQDARAPDGTPLTNEVDAVVSFLVECIQRCLKTPYRYMDESVKKAQSSASILPQASDICAFTSPLLVTVLEQVGARVQGRLQPPSDTLAVFTFIRRLLVVLSSKQDEHAHLHAVLDRLEEIVDGQPFPDCPNIDFAIRRELSIARACLCHLEDGTCTSEETSAETCSIFLRRIEQIPVPESEPARIAAAFELIDWLRLVDTKLPSSDFRRLAAAVQRFYEPAIWALVDHLHPRSGYLWELEVSTLLSKWTSVDGAYGWLYLQSTSHQLKDRRIHETLLTILYSAPVTYSYVERATRLVIHDIGVSAGRHDLTAALLSLVSDILVRAKIWLGKEDLEKLKARVVVISPTIQGLFTSDSLSTELQKATRQLLVASFDHTDMEDRRLLSSMISHWTARMKELLSSDQFEEWHFMRPWVGFMESGELLAAVNLIATNTAARLSPASETLDLLLSVLDQRGLRLPVSKVLELQEVFSGSALLDGMLSATLVSQLPRGFNGEVIFSDQQSLSALLSDFQLPQASKLPAGIVSRFLERETWTSSTGELIVALLYADVASTQAYVTWLQSRQWLRCPPVLFASTLKAFLDCTALSGGDLSQLEDRLLFDLLDQLSELCSAGGLGRDRSLECICEILKFEDDRRPQLVSILIEDIEQSPTTNLAFQTIFIARKVLQLPGCHALVSNIVDRVLQWAVHHVSTEAVDSEDYRYVLENLEHVAKSRAGGSLEFKSHLVEPLLTAIVQTRLTDPALLDLAFALVDNTPLKPVIVHRLLQTVLQHQHFASICGKDRVSHTKNQIARLLHLLFYLHPEETCQLLHIKPLLQVYGGTLSQFDRHLLSIIRLFEATKCTSLSALFAEWSPSPDSTNTNILEVVQGFDSVRVLQTCLVFPSWRCFDSEKNIKGGYGPADDSIYDPAIVIVLTAQMLVECPPTTAFDWVKLFRSNIVSLLIRCLASQDLNVRQAALSQIARIWESLQNADMQEAPQVIYVLHLLKNILLSPTRSGDPPGPMRLPTYASLVLLHALRGIFYPSNFVYPPTMRFLLQRPELDVSDVPMLFGMLYSSSDDCKKERGWILRMLADGMASTGDWRVLKRRHTWDLLASLFQSSKNDPTVRTGILGMLANLTCNAEACTSLVLKSSILSWIEMQVGDEPSKESIAWLKILENIVLVADTSKLNRATGGEWSSTICRILCTILRRKEKVLGILHQSGTVLLRLSLIQAVPDHSLHNALSQAVEYLLYLEPSVDIHRSRPSKRSTPVLPLPPHRAQGLQEMPSMEDSLHAWGEIVEAFWRVGMLLEDGTRAWTALTKRLLVWRALVGVEMCPIGEWARKEVVRIGCTST